jgi:hypothetical protein
VRRGEQLREVTVTPWPASAATVEARAEVVDAGTARDGIERVFGIEPGVTLRAEVASRGTPEDIRISIFKVNWKLRSGREGPRLGRCTPTPPTIASLNSAI